MATEVKRQAVTPEQATAIYGLNLGTLGNLRSRREGPRFYRRGRRILYKIEDLESWLFSEPVQTVDSHREAR